MMTSLLQQQPAVRPPSLHCRDCCSSKYLRLYIYTKQFYAELVCNRQDLPCTVRQFPSPTVKRKRENMTHKKT